MLNCMNGTIPLDSHIESNSVMRQSCAQQLFDHSVVCFCVILFAKFPFRYCIQWPHCFFSDVRFPLVFLLCSLVIYIAYHQMTNQFPDRSAVSVPVLEPPKKGPPPIPPKPKDARTSRLVLAHAKVTLRDMSISNNNSLTLTLWPIFCCDAFSVVTK